MTTHDEDIQDLLDDVQALDRSYAQDELERRIDKKLTRKPRTKYGRPRMGRSIGRTHKARGKYRKVTRARRSLIYTHHTSPNEAERAKRKDNATRPGESFIVLDPWRYRLTTPNDPIGYPDDKSAPKPCADTF